MGSVELEGLVTAVRSIAATRLDGLPDAVVADELVGLRRLADVAEAAYLTRLAVFDSRGVSETTQALSTKAWVRYVLHVAPGETTRALKIAHGLTDLPVVAAALAAGEIRVPHAAAIIDGASLLGTDVIAGCQDALVDAARHDDPTRLRAALRGYGAAVDNKHAVKRAEKRDQGRWLDIATTFDGAVNIQGVLGGEDGAIVNTAVDALAKPTGADDDRTPAQRRADALVELCRRQLAGADLPTTGGHTPHVTVITDLATIEARTGGFGELPDGTILRGQTVRRLACDAGITRLIVGPDSQPLDVGRTQRTATPAQRKALHVRDNGCRFPGCDRPTTWTDIHHVRHWAHGGRTDVDEMISLCRKHHTAVHEGGWTIHQLAPGRFIFTNPDGHLTLGPPRETTTNLVARLITLTQQPPRAGPADNDEHHHAA